MIIGIFYRWLRCRISTEQNKKKCETRAMIFFRSPSVPCAFVKKTDNHKLTHTNTAEAEKNRYVFVCVYFSSFTDFDNKLFFFFRYCAAMEVFSWVLFVFFPCLLKLLWKLIALLFRSPEHSKYGFFRKLCTKIKFV